MIRLLHLSDTHVSAAGPDEDGVDAVGSLERMLDAVRHVEGIEAVVVSGDVADDGSEAGCATVRDLVGAFARERGAPQFHCVGNHDRRPGFRAALGSGHLGADGSRRPGTVVLDGEACAASSVVAGLRIVTLDSLVPGRTEGRVSGEQLEWLAGVLATPAPRGTLLVLHHPLLAMPAFPHVSRVALQDPEALEAVIRGTDVRAIATGHLHLAATGTAAGVPSWIAPGVVTRIDTSAPPALVRGVLGAGAVVVELDDGGGCTTWTVAARDPRAGEQVYLVDAATGADAVEPRARRTVRG